MKPNVAVIGAGVVGAAVAARLARLGCRVTLLDMAYPGAGTTGPSFAWINANAKEPRAYFELNAAGMAGHRGRPWFHATGNLTWAADGPGRADLAARDERLRSWGYAVRSLAEREVRLLEPDLLLDGADGCSFYPDEGFAHPIELLGLLLLDAEEHGATLRSASRVVAFEDAGVVLATGERVRADVSVCCCGRWTGQVAGLAGAAIPMAAAERGSPAVGLLAVTSPAPAVLHRVVHAPGVNLRPDGGGRLLLHAEDLDRAVSPDEPPDPALGDELLDRALPLLRRLAGVRIEWLRACVRPLPADGLTVAGWAPGASRLYVLVTHSAITLAPVLADVAAREIAGGPDEPVLAPFRPARFARAE